MPIYTPPIQNSRIPSRNPKKNPLPAAPDVSGRAGQRPDLTRRRPQPVACRHVAAAVPHPPRPGRPKPSPREPIRRRSRLPVPAPERRHFPRLRWPAPPRRIAAASPDFATRRLLRLAVVADHRGDPSRRRPGLRRLGPASSSPSGDLGPPLSGELRPIPVNRSMNSGELRSGLGSRAARNPRSSG